MPIKQAKALRALLYRFRSTLLDSEQEQDWPLIILAYGVEMRVLKDKGLIANPTHAAKPLDYLQQAMQEKSQANA